MSTSKDWLPNSRDGILAMGRDWQSVAGTGAGQPHTSRRRRPCRREKRDDPHPRGNRPM